MLILSRTRGQSIMIGDNVKITVMGVIGNQVKIGVEASKSVPVHREEIFLKIKAERKS